MIAKFIASRALHCTSSTFTIQKWNNGVYAFFLMLLWHDSRPACIQYDCEFLMAAIRLFDQLQIIIEIIMKRGREREGKRGNATSHSNPLSATQSMKSLNYSADPFNFNNHRGFEIYILSGLLFCCLLCQFQTAKNDLATLGTEII